MGRTAHVFEQPRYEVIGSKMLIASPTLELPPRLIALILAIGLLAAIGRGLEERSRSRHREARKQRQRDYRAYLRTDGWKQRRQVALERSGGFCEDCGARVGLDVHHRTYERKGAERPEDLVAVCRDCHRERHRGKRTTIDMIALALLRRWRIWRYRQAQS